MHKMRANNHNEHCVKCGRQGALPLWEQGKVIKRVQALDVAIPESLRYDCPCGFVWFTFPLDAPAAEQRTGDSTI